MVLPVVHRGFPVSLYPSRGRVLYGIIIVNTVPTRSKTRSKRTNPQSKPGFRLGFKSSIDIMDSSFNSSNISNGFFINSICQGSSPEVLQSLHSRCQAGNMCHQPCSKLRILPHKSNTDSMQLAFLRSKIGASLCAIWLNKALIFSKCASWHGFERLDG